MYSTIRALLKALLNISFSMFIVSTMYCTIKINNIILNILCEPPNKVNNQNDRYLAQTPLPGRCVQTCSGSIRSHLRRRRCLRCRTTWLPCRWSALIGWPCSWHATMTTSQRGRPRCSPWQRRARPAGVHCDTTQRPQFIQEH